MLSAMTDGSFASSPNTLSAGGQDEQPCEVNSSTTARGSAWAGRMIATMAQTPSAPDHREIKFWVITVATPEPGYDTMPLAGTHLVPHEGGPPKAPPPSPATHLAVRSRCRAARYA